MKNYKMNEQLIQDVVYNGFSATFILTSKHCKDNRLVKDEPVFDGIDVTTIPEVGAKYLIARSMKDSIHFKKGKTYVFRIAYLSGRRFFLTPASKEEVRTLGYGEQNERT